MKYQFTPECMWIILRCLLLRRNVTGKPEDYNIKKRIKYFRHLHHCAVMKLILLILIDVCMKYIHNSWYKNYCATSNNHGNGTIIMSGHAWLIVALKCADVGKYLLTWPQHWSNQLPFRAAVGKAVCWTI